MSLDARALDHFRSRHSTFWINSTLASLQPLINVWINFLPFRNACGRRTLQRSCSEHFKETDYFQWGTWPYKIWMYPLLISEGMHSPFKYKLHYLFICSSLMHIPWNHWRPCRLHVRQFFLKRNKDYPPFFYPKLAALAKSLFPFMETVYYIHNFKGRYGGTLFRFASYWHG